MTTRDDPRSVVTDDERAMLGALLDGELTAADEQSLLRALAERPALQVALDDAVAQRAALDVHFRPSEMPRSVADGVMAAIAQNDPSADDALMAAMQFVDGESAQESVGFTDAVGFLSTIDAVSRDLQRRVEIPRDVSAAVVRAIEAEAEGVRLMHALLDGEGTSVEVEQLTNLLSVDDVGARVFRAVQSAESLRTRLSDDVNAPAQSREAARAGEAAMQAISAMAAQHAAAAKSKSSSSSSVAPSPSFFDKVRRWALPMGAAALFAVVFLSIGDSKDSSVDDVFAVDDIFGVDDGVDGAVDLAKAPLAVIANNLSDVEALETGGSALVFSTAASQITVIWVSGDGNESEQGT